MRLGNLGYAYYAEKREMEKLDKALSALEGKADWSLIVAGSVYPEAKGKDLHRQAADYELYVEDIKDNKESANAVLLRSYATSVARLAEIAEQGAAAPGLSGTAFGMGASLADNRGLAGFALGVVATLGFLKLKGKK